MAPNIRRRVHLFAAISLMISAVVPIFGQRHPPPAARSGRKHRVVKRAAGAKALEPNRPVILKSNDGITQLTFPAGWKKATDLNNSASIEASWIDQSLYALVITDRKSNIASTTTRQSYFDGRLKALTDTLTDATVSDPIPVSAGRNTGQMVEVKGRLGGIRAGYLFAVIESDNYFHQIGVWTFEEKFGGKRQQMLDVIESLRER